MGAAGTDRLDGSGRIEQQDFGVEALDLDLLLLAGLQGQRADPLELVLLGHVLWCRRKEASRLWFRGGQDSSDWQDGADGASCGHGGCHQVRQRRGTEGKRLDQSTLMQCHAEQRAPRSVLMELGAFTLEDSGSLGHSEGHIV